MKSKIITLTVLLILSAVAVNGQANAKKNNPVGKWKFEAPTAPYNYGSGTLMIALQDKQYTASMSFTGSDYKLPAENVKVEGNDISFTEYIEGQTVKVTLKIVDNSKMTGKANYSEGEVPITLVRENEKK